MARILRTTMIGRKKVTENISERDTFRLTDEEFEATEYGYCTLKDSQSYRPPENTIIEGGAWVMIKDRIPVEDQYRPDIWNIYWGTPTNDSKNNDGYDRYGRYKIDIIMRAKVGENVEKVSLFPHEYFVVTDEALQIYIEEGYQLQTINYSAEPELNLELIQRGRDLTEDEREIIYAIMLDGLTENEACQEYFMSRHIKTENYNIFYKPTPELREQIESMFGLGA